jgi:hypothetical protein
MSVNPHEHLWRCMGCELEWSKQCECDEPGGAVREAICWRCNELTLERLAERYSFGMPTVSGALVLFAALLVVYWPSRPVEVDWLAAVAIWIFVSVLGGGAAALAAFILVRSFHRFRMWWEGWK